MKEQPPPAAGGICLGALCRTTLVSPVSHSSSGCHLEGPAAGLHFSGGQGEDPGRKPPQKMFAFSWAGSALASCAATCACHAGSYAAREVLRRSARLAYCVLFTLAMLLAWLLRDFAKPLIDKLPWIVHSAGSDPGQAWYGQQAVYRVSLGNFLFFGLMSLMMLGVKYKSDRRDLYLQHGGWFVKIALWLLFNVLPFFFPVGLVNAYGWVARIGSGLFLCVQILMLLDFVTAWNDAWLERDDTRYLWTMLGITVAAYSGALGLAGVLFYFFNPDSAVGSDCSLNITLITLTLALALGVSALSLSNYARKGSLFPAALLSLYLTYLAYSALVSEPHGYACNALGHRLNVASTSTLATGMFLALLSVVYSALRVGSNTQLFGFGGAGAESAGDVEAARPLVASDEEGRAYVGRDEARTPPGLDGGAAMSRGATVARSASDTEAAMEGEPVTYNYAFFHLVFALASTYIAMLMTGWGTGAEERDLIDVGWASVWVKLSTQWLTAAAYCWMLLAPNFLPDRDFY